MNKMPQYLIEFRFHGYARKYLKRSIFDVARRFRVKGVTRRRPVPHITFLCVKPAHADIDENGYVNVLDARIILQAAAGELICKRKFQSLDGRKAYIEDRLFR